MRGVGRQQTWSKYYAVEKISLRGVWEVVTCLTPITDFSGGGFVKTRSRNPHPPHISTCRLHTLVHADFIFGHGSLIEIAGIKLIITSQ
jgi:hypothetical protein